MDKKQNLTNTLPVITHDEAVSELVKRHITMCSPQKLNKEILLCSKLIEGKFNNIEQYMKYCIDQQVSIFITNAEQYFKSQQ